MRRENNSMGDKLVRTYMKKLMYNEPGDKHRSMEENINAAKFILQLTHSKALTTKELAEVLPWHSQNQLAAVAIAMSDAGILIKTVKEGKSRFKVNQKNEEFNKNMSKLKKLHDFDSSEEIIKKSKESSKVDDIPYNVEKITSDKNRLVQYMKHIVHLETDVYALKLRYDSLVSAWREVVIDCLDDYTKAEQTVDKMKDDLLKTISGLKEKINAKPSPDTQYVHLELPVLPILPKFEGVKPTEPIYKTPGLFNKKKVNEENSELRRRYEDALSEYNQLYQRHLAKEEQYQRDLAACNAKINAIKDEEKRQNEEAYKIAIGTYDKSVIEWKEELAKKERELETFNKNKSRRIQKQIKNSTTYVKQMGIEQEIQYVVNLIDKCFESQSKLYSYGVIYGKYRTYVAMSSFLDYFLSGRVTTLEGSDGAYNLYEQESRADIIIGKLDDIIDSLEDIKENQYFIYNELQTANSMLALINGQLLFSNVSQLAQLEKLDNIEKNTEVAAFYSKKNAELTDALGFMMALK